MGLMGTSDWAAMAADLTDVRNDNAQSIVVRRGSTTLTAQTVRIARSGNAAGQRQDAGAIEQAAARVVVLGSTTCDIQPGDRFTVSSRLYEVLSVRPNRRVATMAEAEVIG